MSYHWAWVRVGTGQTYHMAEEFRTAPNGLRQVRISWACARSGWADADGWYYMADDDPLRPEQFAEEGLACKRCLGRLAESIRR